MPWTNSRDAEGDRPTLSGGFRRVVQAPVLTCDQLTLRPPDGGGAFQGPKRKGASPAADTCARRRSPFVHGDRRGHAAIGST